MPQQLPSLDDIKSRLWEVRRNHLLGGGPIVPGPSIRLTPEEATVILSSDAGLRMSMTTLEGPLSVYGVRILWPWTEEPSVPGPTTRAIRLHD